MINSPDEFIELRSSENLDDQRRAALESAPEQVWIDVIRNRPNFAEWVAINKTIPLSVITELHRLNDENVNVVLAEKRSTPEHVLFDLCSASEKVRLTLACRKRLPSKCVEMLRNDESDRVRQEIETGFGNTTGNP